MTSHVCCRVCLGQARRPGWSQSVHVPNSLRPFCERKSRQLSAHETPLQGQTYNYRAEVLPRKQPQYFPSVTKHDVSAATFIGQRPGTAHGGGDTAATLASFSSISMSTRPSTATSFREMSVHPGLEGKQGWDTTTTISSKLTAKQRKRFEEAARQNSLRQTRRHTNTNNTRYVSPEQRYKRALRERRKILDSGKGGEYLSKVRTGTLNPPPPHRPKLQLATGNKPRKVKVRACVRACVRAWV